MTIQPNLRISFSVARVFASSMFAAMLAIVYCHTAEAGSTLHYQTTPTVGESHKILLCDINNDGRAELLSFPDGKKYRFINVERWDGQAFQHLWESEEFGFFYDFAWGDVDNDGLCEFVAVGFFKGNQSLLILKHDGGEFKTTIYPLERRQECVAIGDIDNDGTDEIIVARIDIRTEALSRDTLVILRLQNGELVKIHESPGHSIITDFHVDDFDGDGKEELFVAEHEGKASSSHGGGYVYRCVLNLYRWQSGSLIKESPASRDYCSSIALPRVAVLRTSDDKSKRIIVADLHRVSEYQVDGDTISEPSDILNIPESIVGLTSGDYDQTGSDSLLIKVKPSDSLSEEGKALKGLMKKTVRIYKYE